MRAPPSGDGGVLPFMLRVRTGMRRARASYWFVPTLVSVAAGGLAVAVVWADRRGVGASLLGWVSPGADATVLPTLTASGMLTTTGVVFSITVAAVANATSLYGPRILTYFLSDRGNQATLSVFVGAFVFGLVVLFRLDATTDRPVLTSAATLGVGLVATGFLIYFLNHLPRALHASHVVARLGRQLVAYVGAPYPRVGRAGPDPGPSRDDGRGVRVSETGYVVGVAEEDAFEWARSVDGAVRMRVRPGDFVLEGELVLDVVGVPPPDRARGWVRVSAERGASQDAMFVVDELAEIAVRSLSPSLNDPFTAMSTMDWMAAGWAAVLRSRSLSSARYDDGGTLRFWSPPIGFAQYVERYVDQVTPYAVGDRNARLRLVLTVARVADEARGVEGATAVLRRALDAITTAGVGVVPDAEADAWRSRLTHARDALGDPSG